MEKENRQCPQCGNRLFHNEGISKKTGRPYANWKCGQCQYIEWEGKKKEAQNGNAMLMDEIVAFRKEVNERLDKMAEFLAKWLSEKK